MLDPYALTCDYVIILFRKLIETAILWTLTVLVPVIWICRLVNHGEVALVIIENCDIFYKIREAIVLKIQEMILGSLYVNKFRSVLKFYIWWYWPKIIYWLVVIRNNISQWFLNKIWIFFIFFIVYRTLYLRED